MTKIYSMFAVVTPYSVIMVFELKYQSVFTCKSVKDN